MRVDQKRQYRAEKRAVKRAGNRERRQTLKRELRDDPEGRDDRRSGLRVRPFTQVEDVEQADRGLDTQVAGRGRTEFGVPSLDSARSIDRKWKMP